MIEGDFNIDLLKVEHKPKIKEYLDYIMTQGFFHKIIFLQDFLKRMVRSLTMSFGIIVIQLSDHLPYFICLLTMKVEKSEPKYIYIKQTTETSMNIFKHEIITASINHKLDFF